MLPQLYSIDEKDGKGTSRYSYSVFDSSDEYVANFTNYQDAYQFVTMVKKGNVSE